VRVKVRVKVRVESAERCGQVGVDASVKNMHDNPID
jgi:hypothetical protein